MEGLTLQIVDAQGTVCCSDSAQSMASLVCDREYQEGDCIVIRSGRKNIHLWLQVDDALGAELVYLTGDVTYRIPFGEKRRNLSPKAFGGNRHYLYVRYPQPEEVGQYRNLARNVCDQHDLRNLYPHASANVETRGETIFFACNAIDGIRENRGHGLWPYQSWGINRQADAELTIDFGREIETDKIVLVTRADFPHDNWWTQVTLSFSDGTSVDWQLRDRYRFEQVLTFETKRISWLKLGNLKQAEDPSPFPALTQLEVYGRVAEK